MRATALFLFLCLLGATMPGCGQSDSGGKGPRLENKDAVKDTVKVKPSTDKGKSATSD